MAGVVRALIAVAVLVGCGHSQGRWAGPPPGQSNRPYPALPDYLSGAPLRVPPGNVGRYDARVPVAGQAWRPEPQRLDELRLRLAQLDETVVTLRDPALESAPASIEQATWLAVRIGQLTSDRPDIEEEATELGRLVTVLQSGLPADRAPALERMVELLDLIRIQLAATTG